MSAAIVSDRLGPSGRVHAGLARSAQPAPSAQTRLRLTRRGRVVFTGLAATPFVIWAFIAVLGSGGAAADAGAPFGARTFETHTFETHTFEYVTVQQGDSLWAIAESIAPDDDPRVVIDDIVRLNGLDDVVVEPGQRLALPVVP